MWPWEHLAVGYLVYSAYARARTGSRPDDWQVWVLAVSTQLPDLVDKPLAWTFGVVSDGTAIGHSAFVTVPALLLLSVVCKTRSAAAFVPALAIGWLSHLLGDVIYPAISGGDPPAVSVVLWPLVTDSRSPPDGFVSTVLELFTSFVHYLGTAQGRTYVLLELILLGSAVVVWVWDGIPGVRPVLGPQRETARE